MARGELLPLALRRSVWPIQASVATPVLVVERALEGRIAVEMEHKNDPNGASKRKIAHGFYSLLAIRLVVLLSTTATISENMGNEPLTY